jgi:hypothetical protein
MQMPNCDTAVRRARFCTVIQNLDLDPVNNSPRGVNADEDLSASKVNQMRCESFCIVYFLVVRGAHDLETSAVLETGASVQIGGGVHVGDALPSDCRFATHSNMGTVDLCPNVSKRDIPVSLASSALVERRQRHQERAIRQAQRQSLRTS